VRAELHKARRLQDFDQPKCKWDMLLPGANVAKFRRLHEASSPIEWIEVGRSFEVSTHLDERDVAFRHSGVDWLIEGRKLIYRGVFAKNIDNKVKASLQGAAAN